MDQFTVNANDLGNLNQLEVWHDNSGLNAGWYLDKIEVEAKGIKSVFLCEQWLDKSNGDKQIKRILQKEGDFSYTLFVKTGNVAGGGSNAKVFVNLFGSKGESGNQVFFLSYFIKIMLEMYYSAVMLRSKLPRFSLISAT